MANNTAQGKTLEKKGFKLPISGNALVLLIALVLVTAIFSALNPNYFTYGNLINILVSSTLIGLTAIGMTFLIMTGGSDLSAGSVAAFGGVFIAWGLKNTSMNWVLLALIVLAASSVAGIINGLMVTRLNIVPFIATLVSQSLWRGCAYLLCDGRPIAISDAGLKSLGNGMVFGSVPYPVIMTILLFAVFAFVLSSTKFGRSIFAIGGNAEAARAGRHQLQPHQDHLLCDDFRVRGYGWYYSGLPDVLRSACRQPQPALRRHHRLQSGRCIHGGRRRLHPQRGAGRDSGSGLQLRFEHGRRVPVLAVCRPCGPAVRLSGH